MRCRRSGCSTGLCRRARDGTQTPRLPSSVTASVPDMIAFAKGETLVLTPPLIMSERDIDEMFAKTARVIKAVA
jgi:adenosylmethionine-8-amino-7-oxononanoate aminotransferase